MEKIYKFGLNKLSNLQQDLEKYKSDLKLHDSNPLPTCDEDIMKLLDIDDTETFDKLEESVNLDLHLSQPDDVRVLPFQPTAAKTQLRNPIVEISKNSLHLNTLREVVMFKKKFYGNPLGASMSSYRYPVESHGNENADLEPYDDLLISIRFYRPFRPAQAGAQGRPRFNEEFLVRGQQFLSELRDKVSCECKVPLYDVSVNPERVVEPLDTNPGFFFISDTFYNDTRHPANPDYSDVIRKWADTKPKGTFRTSFKTAKMEETRFIDLNVCLGYPQVYQHFGNCEHIFIFSWIQVLGPTDLLASQNYPILRSIEIMKKQRCNVCGEREYTFIVRNSNRHMYDPVYLCRICFNSFHYVDEKKIGVFQAYCANPDPGTGAVGETDEEDDEEEEDDDVDEYEEVGEISVTIDDDV